MSRFGQAELRVVVRRIAYRPSVEHQCVCGHVVQIGAGVPHSYDVIECQCVRAAPPAVLDHGVLGSNFQSQKGCTTDRHTLVKRDRHTNRISGMVRAVSGG